MAGLEIQALLCGALIWFPGPNLPNFLFNLVSWLNRSFLSLTNGDVALKFTATKQETKKKQRFPWSKWNMSSYCAIPTRSKSFEFGLWLWLKLHGRKLRVSIIILLRKRLWFLQKIPWEKIWRLSKHSFTWIFKSLSCRPFWGPYLNQNEIFSTSRLN